MSAAAEAVAEVVNDDAAPPTERQSVNRMADAFRKQMANKMPANTKPPAQTAIAPAAPPAKPAAPPAKPAEKPAEQPPPAPSPAPPPTAPTPASVKPPTAPDGEPAMPKNAKDWKAHNEVKDRAISEAKQAKAEADALKQEALNLKAELETLKRGTTEYDRVKTEYEAVKKERDEFQGFVERFALAELPKFKEHYEGEIKSIAAGVKSFISPEAATKLDIILAMPMSRSREEQIKLFIAELDETDRLGANAVANAYLNISVVERKKAAELDKASENLAAARAVEQKRQQEQQATLQQQQKTLVDIVHQRVAPELEGEEQGVAARFKEQMRQLVTSELDQKGLLEVVGYAAKGQKYDKAISERDFKIVTLEAQVSELTSAQPQVNGTGGSPPARQQPYNNDPMATGRQLGNKFRAALKRPANAS